LIPYGRHQIDQSDIDAVVCALQSDWLTTGPIIGEFEKALAAYTQTFHAVAVSSGTAALHCTAYAIGLKPGDEVIVPAITFAATANSVIALSAKPIIVDVDPHALLIDETAVRKHITPRTKAIFAVDYAGQPCDYRSLRQLADSYGLFLISDSCHALGAAYNDEPVSALADAAVYSFHPVKHITTGEGGAIVTNHVHLAERMRRFRNHGIDSDLHHRRKKATWTYEVVDMGFNYRITDFQCALGLNQLKKADQWIKRRQTIASRYDQAFESMDGISPLHVNDNVRHVYHLYVVRISDNGQTGRRKTIFNALRDKGIGVNVHYIPLNLHRFYQRRAGAEKGQCPVAEAVYETILSLPIYPAMRDADVRFVIDAIEAAVN
jgi:perosamine synthetase